MQLEDLREEFANIQNRLSQIDVKLAEQRILLETKTQDLEDLKQTQIEIQKNIEPLKQHMVVSTALIKSVSVMATIIGIILGLFQIFSKLTK